MDSKLVVLGLFLAEIDRPLNIESKDDRLRTQKAVYLGQLTGVDLGYRYSWYVHGPYSTNLTQDYFAFAALPESERKHYDKSELNDATKKKLLACRPLFEIPNSVNLEKPQWLELLCSWHYLRKVVHYEDVKARETIASQKPHVAPFLNEANQALTSLNYM